MKYAVAILAMLLLVAFVCTACTTETPAGQTTASSAEATAVNGEVSEETTEDPTTEPPVTEPPVTEPLTMPHVSKELSKLLEKVSGLWVDRRYYESLEIDKSVVYPLSFSFISCGQVFSLPISPYYIERGGEDEIFSLMMNSNQNGIIELTYDMSKPRVHEHGGAEYIEWSDTDKQTYANHKVIIDTKKSPINEIKYYIGDKKYDLIRFDEDRDPSRYQVSAVGSGIRIAWQLPRYSVYAAYWFDVYRSEKAGEKGALIGKIDGLIGFSDESPYSFLDTSLKSRKRYYYSLWPYHYHYYEEIIQEFDKPIRFGGTWQIVADVDALMAAKSP